MVVNLVYCVYVCSVMRKDTASFKIRPALRKVLKREAEKQDRTLSWYLETLVEEISKSKKLI